MQEVSPIEVSFEAESCCEVCGDLIGVHAKCPNCHSHRGLFYQDWPFVGLTVECAKCNAAFEILELEDLVEAKVARKADV